MALLVPPPATLRPELRARLHRFVQAGLALLDADAEAGAEVPFAVEERRDGGGPALYSYRPLFEAYVAERVDRLSALSEHGEALALLLDDPGATAYARNRTGEGDDRTALRLGVLWPLLASVAQRQDGFDLLEDAFQAAYGALERAVVAVRRRFEALVPLVGLLVTEPPFDLGAGVRVRRLALPDLAADWPDAGTLTPDRYGIEPDRRCALEIVAHLEPGGDGPPDAARVAASAVMALRLVSGGAIAAGPVLFERLDLAAHAVRPMPPEAALPPVGESVRLDAHALALARTLNEALARPATPGGDAVEVALVRFASALCLPADVERATGCLSALGPLLGGEGAGHDVVALRAAALVGKTAAERSRVASALREVAALGPGGGVAPSEARRLAGEVDAIARAVLAAGLLDERRGEDLAETLDDVLLGARPRPQIVPPGLGLVAA